MPTNFEPQVRGETVKVGFVTVVLAFLVWKVGRGVWWAARQPVLWVALVSGLALRRLFEASGLWAVLGVVAAGTAALVTWRLLHPSSFRQMVWWPLRSWWRRVAVYRPEWDVVCKQLGLHQVKDGQEIYPPVLRVQSTGSVDKVRVRMLPGQILPDYAQFAHRFAQTYEALDCRVRSVPKHRLFATVKAGLRRGLPGLFDPAIRKAKKAASRDLHVLDSGVPEAEHVPDDVGREGTERQAPSRVVELWFLTRDPLAAVVPMLDVAARPNLGGLAVALREDGLVWTLRLLATHVLIVGATGAGKGSVLWTIVRALGHAIRTRLVELWVIDPKGGMEFAAGQALFARYCYGDDAPENDEGEDVDRKRAYELTYAEFLEDAVREMRDRQRRLRGIFRTHKPAPGDPLIVLMIDEIASLTAYVVDREAKKRIESALNVLLSQGRAVGVVIIGAGQDARKEVLTMRGLFPTRIALRLNEAEEVDLVLGNGKHERGARCEEIPDDMPGTGFVVVETQPEPVRLRFPYQSDTEIRTMCSLYEPGASYDHRDPRAGLRSVSDLYDELEEVA
ncbi:FtsK/SpoIIIE domain-containing protein [Tenggerimyces flavus]|uniref:FtsK/SpoIIIE domain-containing protein n=1 Tax=Tenggerimyces flavus TaxID=1708749 RepID=A0ABV7YBM9_9ACTN|nr:FtsK/SpoIIIE domain-containing protein [Tenggerimyces flavus]MBM7783568.1 S-DNA-T family DNA segregation ATPase FtsK/SpoIIIE [Tenggerimyces flavus]